MADWQERVQSMIIGFVFAYMVMKLFSVIANFRAGNMRVERATEEEEEALVRPVGGEPASDGQVGTDEETEADGGDEQEEAHRDSSSSSSSDSEADGDVSRDRGADEATTTVAGGVESKDVGFKGVEDVEMESKDVVKPGEESLKALTTDDP